MKVKNLKAALDLFDDEKTVLITDTLDNTKAYNFTVAETEIEDKEEPEGVNTFISLAAELSQPKISTDDKRFRLFNGRHPDEVREILDKK